MRVFFFLCVGREAERKEGAGMGGDVRPEEVKEGGGGGGRLDG